MEPKNYESALQELRDIVNRLQNEFTNLDELVAMVDRGNYLVAFCKERLREVEGKLGSER